jgi:anti-sigma factor RsiW
MLRCREVVDLIGTDAWRTAPLGRRLSLAMHLAMCRHCRSYALSLRRIARAARALYRVPDEVDRSERLLESVRRAAELSEAD